MAPSLVQVEDRRRFHPENKNRPALLKTGLPAPVTVVNKARPKPKTRKQLAQVNRFGAVQPSQTKAVVAFAAPRETVVCVRRQSRKEVLFAKGKGGGGKRPPKRTWLSKISCR